jgi:DNA replication protein DnaC
MNQPLLTMQLRPIHCATHGDQEERGFLNRWFGCPVCSAAAAAEQDRQALESLRHDSIRKVGLPSLYAGVEFRSWDLTDNRQKPILSRCFDYARSLQPEQCTSQPNLVLAGSTGTGKTHLAACVLRAAAGQMVRCRYVTAAQIMAEIRASWDPRTRTRHESEILQHYGQIPVLLIDEVGVSDHLASAHDVWSSLLDQRYREQRPTLITTNLDQEQLAKHLGARAFDRLMQRCIWAGCVWESYRQLKAQREVL